MVYLTHNILFSVSGYSISRKIWPDCASIFGPSATPRAVPTIWCLLYMTGSAACSAAAAAAYAVSCLYGLWWNNQYFGYQRLLPLCYLITPKSPDTMCRKMSMFLLEFFFGFSFIRPQLVATHQQKNKNK